MDKVVGTLVEVLAELLPESDFGKVIYLIIAGLFVLIVTGRLKLEWIGEGLKYMWRRLVKCPRGKHSWKQAGIGYLDDKTGGLNGLFKCVCCGEQRYMTATF